VKSVQRDRFVKIKVVVKKCVRGGWDQRGRFAYVPDTVNTREEDVRVPRAANLPRKVL